MSTLDYWDTHIKPYLSRIRLRSAGLRYDVRALAAKPNFETMARDDLADVRRELERALARIDSAIAGYDAKPELKDAA